MGCNNKERQADNMFQQIYLSNDRERQAGNMLQNRNKATLIRVHMQNSTPKFQHVRIVMNIYGVVVRKSLLSTSQKYKVL